LTTPRAIASLFRDEKGNEKQDLSHGEIKAALADERGLLWVDVREESAENQRLLREVFGFHQLAIEDCFNDRMENAKIDDYGSHLFVVSQHVAYNPFGRRVSFVELGLFLGPNYVVTVHHRPLERISELLRLSLTSERYLEHGAAFLAHAILDALVDDLLPAVEGMDEQLDELEGRILASPQPAQLNDVLLLKRNALRLRRVILSQRDSINRLARDEFPDLIPHQALIFFRDIYDHILRVEAMIDGLRDLADTALSSYLSAVNNRTNEIMKAMSVVAVIFLPLTLIASIFGTNLDYSLFGASFKAGFYLMLAVMLAIAGGLILYFRRRGWF
jgi:magnesium transporter